MDAMFRRKCTVAEDTCKSWKELCGAALEAKQTDELLKIVQDLNRVLKNEEQLHRELLQAGRGKKSTQEVRC
jgi:hypothetical protein